jgi:hypothetical protein
MSTTAPDQTSIQSILATIQSILSSLGKNTSNIDTASVTAGLNSIQRITNNADEKNKKLLLNQKEMKALVETENARIQSNIQRVEDNLTTKKRMVDLSENTRLRTEQYNQILYTFVFAAVVIIAIVIGSRLLPFLPEFISQVLIVIVGAAAAIKIFMIYSVMRERSPLNYNELNLDKPVVDTPEQIQQKLEAAAKKGDLLGSIDIGRGSIDIGGCMGAECCDPSNNIVWNATSRKCTYQAPFGNMNGFVIERLKYNKNVVSPNTPSEINTYSKV